VAEQNLDFNIIAHTQGMEQIANLINRVGALEAETKKLASANTTLTKSTEAVVVNGKRYNTALDAQSKALRNARQGTQQLGMQFNDLATSISTGASPVQAFNQQLGQIGFALSMMGGRLGAVGNFLAGPWGAALLIGTMAVSYLIETLSAGSEAAAKLDVASSSLGEAQSSLGDMFDISTGKIKSNTAETRLNTLAKIANLRVMAAEAQAAADARFNKIVDPGVFERAKNIGADVLGAIYTPGAGMFPGVFNKDFVADLEDSRKGAVAFYTVADAAFKELAAGSKTAGAEIENLFKKGDQKFQQYLLNRMKALSYTKGAELGQQSFDQGVLDSALISPDKTREKKPKAVSEADKLRAAQEAVIAEYQSGALSLGEFETKLVAVTDAFQDAQNPAQDWLKQFKEANDNVEKFKKSTNDLTKKALPDYINKLRDLEAQYEGIQKSEKMTSDLQIGFMNAIKATATGPIDTLIKKYENLHTGMTQFEQDQAAAKAVLDALAAETGEAAGVGADAAREAIGRLSKAMDDARIREKNEEIKNSFESIGMAVSDSFKGMITGAMSFKESMKSIIGAVIDQLWKLFVVQKIVGIISGALGAGATAAPSSASGFGNIGMSSPGSFKPVTLRAFGGSVSGKTPYMVGERGPELFVPGGNGTIIPNGNMRGGGSGGSPISINVDARGSSDPAAVRAQVQQGILEAAPAIIAAAESRTIAGLRRPRLGGAMQ
jgi:hypothetical protein